MELTSNFLPQFKIQQPQFTWGFSKHEPLVVFNIFSREAFPVSCDRWKNIEVHCNNDQSIRHTPLSKNDNSKLPELSFNRLQQTEDDYSGLQRLSFGRFIAREAMLDEELWTAAWLRAEANWESVSYMRHVDAYKRKYAEQEFYALKRRCSGQDGNCLKCFCFVAVKKEEKNVRRTVLNSVVGTLDLTIRQFVQRERYPGEIKRLSAVLARQDPFDSHKYAYISNVCVAKFARRQGIASNMIHLAADVAALEGFKQLFVHVNADNKPGQELYRKTGFKLSFFMTKEPAASLQTTQERFFFHDKGTCSQPANHTGEVTQRRLPIVDGLKPRRQRQFPRGIEPVTFQSFVQLHYQLGWGAILRVSYPISVVSQTVKIVEAASSSLSKEQMLLMSLDI